MNGFIAGKWRLFNTTSDDRWPQLRPPNGVIYKIHSMVVSHNDATSRTISSWMSFQGGALNAYLSPITIALAAGVFVDFWHDVNGAPTAHAPFWATYNIWPGFSVSGLTPGNLITMSAVFEEFPAGLMMGAGEL